MTQPIAGIDVSAIVDWLVDGAPPAREPSQWLHALCERLLDVHVGIDRMAVFVRPLHPNVAARAFYWRKGSDAIEVNEEAHAFMSTDEQRDSPIRVVIETRAEIRCRLCEPASQRDYPVFDELRADGFTDYLILPLEFIGGEVHAWSVATRSAGGFSDAEVGAITRLRPALTRLVEIQGLMRKAGNILDAYLGRHAGSRVLQGRIQRGAAETLHAIIWFCDLRDSTVLADSMSPQAYLSTLNDYFDCVLTPVQARDGDVLCFIGDAAVAIFRVGDVVADAASRAVVASTEAIARMETLNRERQADDSAPLRFSIGLHIGDVLYGNVGTATRIQFTVVGAAANEAARIESLCKALDVTLLASADVVRHAPPAWRSVGTHRLRGVGKPVELFTLRPASAASVP